MGTRTSSACLRSNKHEKTFRQSNACDSLDGPRDTDGMARSRQWTAVRPPRIATASDIPYPVNTATPGIVTLLLNLDVAGKVLNVQVLRDLLPLTSAAQTAVQTCTLHPGRSQRKSRALHSFCERCL